MINKYNRVFFAPNIGGIGTVVNPLGPGKPGMIDPTPIPTVTKKKRNLVALSTPLIIKLTPYEKEETIVDGTSGEETTKTSTYFKTNKNFNQILDAYLMDRTIKFYREEEDLLNEEITQININLLTVDIKGIRFSKNIKDNKSLYIADLNGITFFSTSPNTYMTNEENAFADLLPEKENNPISM